MLDTVMTAWYLFWTNFYARRLGKFFGLRRMEVLDALDAKRRELGRRHGRVPRGE